MNKKILYLLGFLIKGWEVSLLLVLPIIQTKGIISVFELGILAAFFSVFQILTSLLAGSLAQKFSSKIVMTASVFFYGLSWLIISSPINFLSLLISYSLGGIGQGCFIPLANSQIAKLSDKNRAKELGDFSAFTDIGRVALTVSTTFLISKVNINLTSLIFVFLASLAALLLIKTTISNGMNKVKANTLQVVKITDLLKIKSFIFAVLTGVFDVFSSASLYIFIPLLLIPKGINISSVGILSALFFAGYLAGRLILARLADKYGAVKILAVSQTSMAVLIFILVFVNNFLLISLILFILGIFTRGTSPVIRAMMADSVKEKEKFDKAFSFHSFSLNTANVASRSAYGLIAGILGITSVFYLSAFVALFTLLPLYLYKNSKN